MKNADEQSIILIHSFNLADLGDYEKWQKYGGYPVNEVVEYLTVDDADILFLQEATLENEYRDQVFFNLKLQLELKGYHYNNFFRPNYSKGRGTVGYVKGMKNSEKPLAIFSKLPMLETYAIQSLNGKKMRNGVLGGKIQLDGKSLFVFNTQLDMDPSKAIEEMKSVVVPFIKFVSKGKMVVVSSRSWKNLSKENNLKLRKKIDQPLIECGFKSVYPEVIGEEGEAMDISGRKSGNQIDYYNLICTYNVDNFTLIKLRVKEDFWSHNNLIVEP